MSDDVVGVSTGDTQAEEYLTINEAAATQRYGSRMTLWRRVKAGVLPAYESDNRIYVRVADLEKLIEFKAHAPEAVASRAAHDLARVLPDCDDETRSLIKADLDDAFALDVRGEE